ncbi:MAG: helix-hairpin-helix domain-containing protein [Desulfobacterota bacterium]|nr:helix-hairpin-helix domain-containing protein [Thermodesulfobacteriota bacterium]MDW8002314.1 Holliday junction branch migration protein RuvA [Deltaproteobacteria bacterium]
MIRYLSGQLISLDDDRATVLVGGIGYEILLPFYVMQEIKGSVRIGENISLFISYNQSQRNPKPVLVGFTRELDREFFELFISVEDMGPLAAVKALVLPIGQIAKYIEDRNVKALTSLRGVGERRAEKIVATLKGKVAKYALSSDVKLPHYFPEDFKKPVENVLTNQLGYTVKEARRMIEEALKRNPSVSSSEELFEEIYRVKKNGRRKQNS